MIFSISWLNNSEKDLRIRKRIRWAKEKLGGLQFQRGKKRKEENNYINPPSPLTRYSCTNTNSCNVSQKSTKKLVFFSVSTLESIKSLCHLVKKKLRWNLALKIANNVFKEEEESHIVCVLQRLRQNTEQSLSPTLFNAVMIKTSLYVFLRSKFKFT